MSITPESSRKRKSLRCQKSLTKKKKSLRAQHSISLHIPMDELSSRNCGINCYIDLPEQVFSLTYLTSNETNPDSLSSLDCLMKVKWQAYRVGFLYNMDYKMKTLKVLEKALDMAFKRKIKNNNDDVRYYSAVSVVDNLNPTDNDNQALNITVSKHKDERRHTVYEAFVMSWCNPIKQRDTFLPLMLCWGAEKIKTIVNNVLHERHEVKVTRLLLPQDEFQYLTTYCTIMFDQVDNYEVTTSYRLPSATIKLSASVPTLLGVWETIHQDESNEVDIDEILQYNNAMEAFYESVYGLKLGRAYYNEFNIEDICSIHAKGVVWFNSTKTIHVVLKFLNYFIAQQLKLRVLNYLGESNSVATR